MTIIAIILIILVVAYVAVNIRIVPQANAWVIERLGKYSQTWDAGLHVKVPFIERVIKKVSLKEQVFDFPPQPVITKDNVTMQIDSVVFCKVFDPNLYTYGVERPIEALQNLAATTLRQIVGSMELDQTLTGRDQINATMRQVLDDATDPWGIKVTRVEIKNIKPPKEIEEVMTKQMRAERQRRQTVLKATAHKEGVVSVAEGDKEAKILRAEAEKEAQIRLAEGRAQAIERIYAAEAMGIKMLNEAGVSPSVLKLKSIEALKDVANGRATKIFMPSDIAGAVSALGIAGEALGIAKTEDNDDIVTMEEDGDNAFEEEPIADADTGSEAESDGISDKPNDEDMNDDMDDDMDNNIDGDEDEDGIIENTDDFDECGIR